MPLIQNKNYSLASGVAMTANYTSAAVPIGIYYGASIQAVYTGSPVGTLALQASNDGVNYTAVPSASQSVSGAGSYIFDVNSNAAYLQVIYTFSSGSGTLSLQVNAKTT